MRGRLVAVAGSLVVVVVTIDQAQRGGVPLFGEPLQQNIVVSKAYCATPSCRRPGSKISGGDHESHLLAVIIALILAASLAGARRWKKNRDDQHRLQRMASTHRVGARSIQRTVSRPFQRGCR